MQRTWSRMRRSQRLDAAPEAFGCECIWMRVHPVAATLRIGDARSNVTQCTTVKRTCGTRATLPYRRNDMEMKPTLRRALLVALGAGSTITATLSPVPSALASNHSDAPLIKQDPQANLTDVYAFIGKRYDDASQKVLNVTMSFRPFSEPGDGAQYDRFADDVRYSIHITDPKTGATKLRYD